MKTEQIDTTRTETIPAALAELTAAGSEALAAGDLGAARTSFAAAVELCPTEPVSHNNLGAFFMGLGAFAEAEACFEQVTNLIPDHANSLFNLAMARFQQEKFAAASLSFEQVAALTPDDPEVLNNLGATRCLSGDNIGARRVLEAALTLQSNFPNAVLNLCDLEISEGHQEAAMSLCEGYLEHNRDLSVLRRLLELLDNQARRTVEQAIPHAEAIIAANVQDNATRRHLGRLLEARQALTAEG